MLIKLLCGSCCSNSCFLL